MKHVLTYSGHMLLFVWLLSACGNINSPKDDLIHNPFPEEQVEIRKVIDSIVKDAETANIAGLQAIHLNSEKFTKFGPRHFHRQDVKGTNQSEAAHFGSISNFKQQIRGLKIDVFGDIAIATYYPQVSFIKDGTKVKAEGRQTLVFLKTEVGWKIVHEHGTIKQ